MFCFDAHNPAPLRDGMTRRDFLHAGALSLLGISLTLPEFVALPAQGGVRKDKGINCILLFLRGAPSQLDTWDMKPDAPMGIRGPFKPIKTNVPGMEISELFPRMANRADLFSIVRSVCHTTAVTHDTGQQIMRMGSLFSGGLELPNIGSGAQGSQASPHAALMSSPKIREACDMRKEPAGIRDKYGRNRFGQSCLLARRMVERGVRCVTINMFENVFDEVTWDIHGSAPFPTMDAYKTVCGPWFDNGYTSLIEELRERGLYDSTIVMATGEFGRAPRINRAGGRDHWPHCWSLILGGGGIKGGRIVGASDNIGAYPTDRPTTPADIAATLYTASGIDLPREIPVPGDHSIPTVADAARPLYELL